VHKTSETQRGDELITLLGQVTDPSSRTVSGSWFRR
jgi:hypothetical protein